MGLGWSLSIDIDIFCGLNPCDEGLSRRGTRCYAEVST